MHLKALFFSQIIGLPILLTIIGNDIAVAQSGNDTIIEVPDVVVTATRSQYFGNDIKTEVYTRNKTTDFAGESITRLLTSNSALNVKAYGAGGGLANITLRGSSASQVQVNWNGFPINSVTAGACDFSMVPASGFDRVSVVYGASGAVYGSGTFGGAVNLDNNLTPSETLSGSAHIGYQSLKTIDGSIFCKVGNGKAAWQLNCWGAASKNEFKYYDYINQYQRTQTDGDWHDIGTIQNAAFRLSPTSTLEVGFWYQVKAYNIPSHIGSTAYEYQKDSTLKLFAAYKLHGENWGLQVKAARFDDEQHYWQKASAQATVNSIDSRIQAVQWYGDVNFRYYITPHLSVDAGSIGALISADVSAYGNTKEEKELASFVGIKYDNKQFSWQAALRKEWNSDFHSDLLPSVGAAVKIIPDTWTVRANASKKFRKPTFNDRYWMPGGNINLKAENGYSAELGTLATFWKSNASRLSADISLYWSQVKDMIVWRPAGAYWEAKNYQQVHSYGAETKIMFNLQKPQWQYQSELMVTLNRALFKTEVDNQEKPMIYSPRIITTWKNQFNVGFLEFTLWHHFTADRFYDDNALLKPYQTIDAQIGIKQSLGKGKIGLLFAAYNLTNKAYELIRLYPMPGRYWSVKLNYMF